MHDHDERRAFFATGIVEVDDAWHLELDIDGPAHLTLDEGGRGELCFFLLEASR